VHEGSSGQTKLAIKIYRVHTSNYKKMTEYLLNDPRFRNTRRDKQSIVYSFTKKEYRNLQRAHSSGIRCPRPIAFRNNVLVMEFIGNGGPAPTLKKSQITDPATLTSICNKTISDIKTLYQKAGLVHGDASEYNIIIRLSDLTPYLIDFSQSVLTSHPNSGFYLKRDIRNLTRFFSKRGVRTMPRVEIA